MGTYNDMIKVMKKYRFKEVTLSNGMVIRKNRDGSIKAFEHDGEEMDNNYLETYFCAIDAIGKA